MVLHNTMEDLVLNYLEEILKNKDDICKCYYCKLDMAAYALNRTSPMYVVSSRGIIHTENIKRRRVQEEIDVYSIVAEAIDVVSRIKRHDVDHDQQSGDTPDPDDACKKFLQKFSDEGVFYNFPQIVGRVFDGATIKILNGAKITLCAENSDEEVHMCNSHWQNPIELLPQMEGTFTFWPCPVPCEKAHIQKDFYFNLKIEKEGYEEIRKYFFIRTISAKELRHNIKKENIHYLDDIYLTQIERV